MLSLLPATKATPATRLLLSTMALVISSCSSAELARGPLYHWEEDAFPQDYLPHVPLKFVDERPGWERHYYATAENPRAYRFAAGMVPLENLRPTIPERLVQVVDESLLPLGVQPEFGTLRLQSFRVVINELEVRKAEYDLKYGRNRPSPFKVRLGKNVTVDVGLSLSSDPEPPPPPAYTMPPFQYINGKRVKVGPPKELDMQYCAGVTCQIDAVAQLVWDGEADFEIPVHCHVELDPAQARITRDEAIQQTVDRAIEDFRSQVQTQLRARNVDASTKLAPPSAAEQAPGHQPPAVDSAAEMEPLEPASSAADSATIPAPSAPRERPQGPQLSVPPR